MLLCNTKILQILPKNLKVNGALPTKLSMFKKKKTLDYYMQGLKKQDERLTQQTFVLMKPS